MSEYARFNGREVKIGTCEDMYYLRADQADRVTPIVPGNVDPVKDAAEIRFRFPFPDEDAVEPGAFRDPFRTVEVEAPVPDHEGRGNVAASNVAACGCPALVRISQQRLVEDRLVLICECGGCGWKYRIPTLAEAAPVVKACIRAARRATLRLDPPQGLGSAVWRKIARRIVAGYRRNEGVRS